MGISHYVEKREHEITEYLMEPQQILPAFVSHLGSKNSIEPGPPHEALFFVLAYLDVFELLVMSEVCMPLRDAVSKDVLPWRNIIIDRPLNSRLSDEILVRITTRAHGRLRTLALINCFKITDDGLQTVIEKNRLISKLKLQYLSLIGDMGISHYVEKKEHEITEYLMEPQQILPAFVSHLGSKNRFTNREVEPGPPHEALFFVLAYLDVFELLVMSEVCMPLRDAVSKDVLPWRNIIIDRPLNSRLSDEILVRITTRAHGRLRTLALINCFKITDDGLQTVIEKNHLISKLHIPGCSGLTPEGIIRVVKTLSPHHNSLESLQINGISSLKKEHLETISSHLQMNPPQQKPQPILYRHHRNSFTSRNKGSRRVIDVDICPKCNEVRIVFDCARATSESGREQPFTHCRGCYFCISRCEECGRCVDDEEVEETLCSGILCTDCWLRLPKCCSCNKAYCKQHANQQCSSPDTTGFLCDLCNEKLEFTGN